MTRTYLKSSSAPKNTSAGVSKLSVLGGADHGPNLKTGWRAKKLTDGTLDSPEIALKSRKCRKPLKEIKNLRPGTDDQSVFSLENSPPSLTVSADNTFDKLIEKKSRPDDPFDKLFEKVNDKAIDVNRFFTYRYDRVFDITPNPSVIHQENYHSVFSTPSETEVSKDNSNQAGLFSSFTKHVDTNTPKLKKKSHRSVRTKKKQDKEEYKPRENILSETLAVQVVFENDISPKEDVAAHQSKVSSLATIQSPIPLRTRTLTALSVATSTPVLTSRSSDISLSDPSPPCQNVTLSPVQDPCMEDDVFVRKEETVDHTSPASCISPNNLPSEEEYFEPTPPMKSFVNNSRGNPRFGGPAASLMNHIEWRFTMHTIQGDTSSVESEEVGDKSNPKESDKEDKEQSVEEITVNIACICGDSQMTSSQVIQCDHCAMWFHTDCMGLTMSCIEEIEGFELDWFCKRCIEEARNNPDSSKNFTLSTPCKQENQVQEGGRTSFAPITDSIDVISMSATEVSSMETTSSRPTPPTQSFPSSVLTAPSRMTPQPSSVVSPPIQSLSNKEIPSGVFSCPQISPSTVISSSTMSPLVDSLSPPPSFLISPPNTVVMVSPTISSVMVSPTISSVMVSTSPVTVSPTTSPTSVLSLTAQLESHHLAHSDSVQDASLLFIKPSAPPKLKKKQARNISPTHVEEDLQLLKAGKSWRRSLSLVKRSSIMFTVPRSTLPSVEYIDPTPAKPLPRRSTRRTHVPISEESIIPPTPQKRSVPSIRSSRSTFCVVPSMSKVLDEGTQSTRLSTLHTLSETLLVEESIISESNHANITTATSLDKLLRVCTIQEVLCFDHIYPPEVIEGSIKVGEGAFGEVFLIGASGDDRPVLKVVPIDGDIPVNGENQTKIEDMMSEVIISDALSKLRQEAPNTTSGFVEVRGCHVFQGVYPPQLLALWDAFKQEHESENERPDNLPVDQLYIALEFNNAGKDLEKFIFKHATQALQAWKQVAHSLAVAEEELQFEHRDLHWGNVLVKETTDKFVQFTLRGDTFQVETGGVQTSIIDFSLSRLSMDKVTIFNNLSEDPTLFTARGKGQPGGDYQFDIYRKMREANKNEWEEFTPKTNLLWLDYMLEKMMTEVYYSGKKTAKPHKSGISKMRNIRRNLEDFSCVSDWVRREGERVD